MASVYKLWDFGARTVQKSLYFQFKFPEKVFIRRIQIINNNHNCSLRSGKGDSRGALVVLEGLDRCGKNKSQLDDHTIHLLFSANRWEKRSLMESKLTSGTTLVVDRYSYSGVAFSSAKGLNIEWCKKAADRGGYGGERYEQLGFQKKIAQNFQLLRDPSWKIIDAYSSMDDAEEHLQEIALDCVKTCQEGKPLSCIWSS